MGRGGQGYSWHPHGADGDSARYSIAPPPPAAAPVLADDCSDEESQAATNDDAPDVQPVDPDASSHSLLPTHTSSSQSCLANMLQNPFPPTSFPFFTIAF